MDKHTIKTAIIACQVLQPELEYVGNGDPAIGFHYLEQSLHRTPQNMSSRIQGIVDGITGTVDRIVLGYGLCSNGILGVTARAEELIVPRCHDCISFFLGSPAAYQDDFASRPGTYYLTPGWIEEKKDPLHILTEEYYPRYGEEVAEWAMREELKHYSHIVLIDTGLVRIEPLREIARENAAYFKLEYLEIQAQNLDYFKRLLKGPYEAPDFLRLQPGQAVQQDMFF